ncbi:MAG TPA: DUF4476 domain-containing protein [Fluviicola sp.]|nr:DUF4476 domain-containing protein [Fluviicola sp.]
MKIFATLSMLLIAMASFAQNVSMTIFNNNGQQFFVVMNGIRQNSLPLTNIKIGGMSPGSYEVKLIFADGKTGDINKKIYIDQSGDYLARVVFKGKKRKLQYFGMSNEVTPGGTDIQYRPNDQSVYSDQASTMSGSQGTQTSGLGTVTSGQTGNVTQSGQGTVVSGQSGNGTQSGQGTVVSGQGTQTSGTGQGGGSMSTSGTITDPTQGGQFGVGSNVVITDPMMGGTGGVQTSTSGTQSGTVTSGTTITDPNNPNGQFGMNININISDPMMGGNGTGISTGTTITDPNNPGGFGMNMNVSGMDPGMGGTSTSSSTSTTTTSSSTTIIQNGQVIEDSHDYNQTTTVTENGQTTTTTTSSQSGNPGSGNGSAQVNWGNGSGFGNDNQVVSGSGNVQGNTNTNNNGNNYSCTSVLTDTEGFMKRLKAEAFDSDQREMIENELKNQCVSADQAYRMIKELDFDTDRYDMCIYLYDRMTDRVNGSRLLELLNYDLDKEAFQEYMQAHK